MRRSWVIKLILNLLWRGIWPHHLKLFYLFCMKWVKWSGLRLRRYDYSSLAHVTCNLVPFPPLSFSLVGFSSQEFKKILDFKRGRTGQSVEDLEPWDEAYFTRIMKSHAHNLDYSVNLHFHYLIIILAQLHIVHIFHLASERMFGWTYETFETLITSL